MELLISICVGLSLSAACGFRIFVPPLVLSLAAVYGHIPLADNFDWLATYPALIALAIATVVEISAYYIPFIDNFLDILATPTAIAVSTLLTAALVPSDDPLLQWTTAVIAGGSAAGIVKGVLSLTRLSSTALTGGLGNSLIATLESGSAVILSVLGILVPVLAAGLVVVLLIFGLQQGIRSFKGLRKTQNIAES